MESTDMESANMENVDMESADMESADREVAQKWDDVARYMRDAGLVRRFKRGKPNRILVIEPAFRDAFIRHHGTLIGQIASAETVDQMVKPKTSVIFVFLSQGEFQLVRRLRAAYPDIPVISVTYDLILAPLAQADQIRAISARPKPDTDARPYIILATPGSDSEYLSAIMEKAGLGRPVEYGGRLLMALSQVSHFSPLKFGFSFFRHQSGTHPTGMIIGMDVLDHLNANGTLKWQDFSRYIKRTGTRLIYLMRRDKLMQVGMASLFADEPFRSIWKVDTRTLKRLVNKPLDFATTHQGINDLIHLDIAAEQLIMDGELDAKVIAIEDVIANPMAVVRDIGHFIGEKVPPRLELPNYATLYRSVPGLLDRALRFQREMIDRMGLHVNDYGSFETETGTVLRQAEAREILAAPEIKSTDPDL